VTRSQLLILNAARGGCCRNESLSAATCSKLGPGTAQLAPSCPQLPQLPPSAPSFANDYAPNKAAA
jgi:hypothetical protein